MHIMNGRCNSSYAPIHASYMVTCRQYIFLEGSWKNEDGMFLRLASGRGQFGYELFKFAQAESGRNLSTKVNIDPVAINLGKLNGLY